MDDDHADWANARLISGAAAGASGTVTMAQTLANVSTNPPAKVATKTTATPTPKDAEQTPKVTAVAVGLTRSALAKVVAAVKSKR